MSNSLNFIYLFILSQLLKYLKILNKRQSSLITVLIGHFKDQFYRDSDILSEHLLHLYVFHLISPVCPFDNL